MKARDWILLLNFLLLVAVLLLQYCGNGNDSSLSGRDTLKTEIIYKHDSIIHDVEHHHYHREVIHESIPPLASGDSFLIAQDYFSKRIVRDSIQDSILAIWINDTIFKNDLWTRNVRYKLLRPQTIQNIVTVSDRRRKALFLGLGVGIPQDKFKLNLSSAILFPNDQILGIDYDLTSNDPALQRFSIRYLKKLSLKPP